MSTDSNYNPIQQTLSPNLRVTTLWTIDEYRQGAATLRSLILKYFTDDVVFSIRTPSGPDAMFYVKAPSLDKDGKLKGGRIDIDTLGAEVEWPEEITRAQWSYFALDSVLKLIMGSDKRQPLSEAKSLINDLMARSKLPPKEPQPNTMAPVLGYETNAKFHVWNNDQIYPSDKGLTLVTGDQLRDSLAIGSTTDQQRELLEKLAGFVGQMLTESARPPRPDLIQEANEKLKALGFPTTFEVVIPPTAVETKSLLDFFPDYDPDIHDSPTQIVEEEWTMSFAVSDGFDQNEESMLGKGVEEVKRCLMVELGLLPLAGVSSSMEWATLWLDDVNTTSTSDKGAYEKEFSAISIPKPGDKLQFYWSSHGSYLYARLVS